MGTHRLADGREVHLVRLAVAGTYAGWLEGTPERVSAEVLRSLPERAARLLPPAAPLAVVPPGALPLPDWLCVAELASRTGARATDPDCASRPYVCWFAGDTGWSTDAAVESVLPHLDWDQAAEDYDITDF